jgi:hypothetical protein
MLHFQIKYVQLLQSSFWSGKCTCILKECLRLFAPLVAWWHHHKETIVRISLLNSMTPFETQVSFNFIVGHIQLLCIYASKILRNDM